MLFSNVLKSSRSKNPSLNIGVTIFSGMLILGVIGLVHPPQNPFAMSINHRFEPPNFTHWMGTDQYGRDIFSRLLVSLASSFTIAFSSLVLGMLAGVTIGGLSGYIEGVFGESLMRFVDALYAFPHILLALLVLTVLGPGEVSVSIALVIFNAPVFARITYGAVLEGKHSLYAQTAKCMGGGTFYILRRHVSLYVAPSLLVQATSSFSLAILVEASLSYLGLGVQPPHPSLGGMLASAQNYLQQSYWTLIFPGLFLILVVLGSNLSGDGIEGRFGRW
ncbi:ABC transporter permease [Alicyclobacillus sp. SO9]|uniref:ABC transporter permease n=1 Tax=Alicyclobacillus sp. SO9 TaxID=2665646 RepID=UPI0018E7EDE5|nr:ABC transporter permease [Alicyclobacillus sp. SO9]QQE78201.1 ABC transporter permease [Alicyclobacillus sp. SO9]